MARSEVIGGKFRCQSDGGGEKRSGKGDFAALASFKA